MYTLASVWAAFSAMAHSSRMRRDSPTGCESGVIGRDGRERAEELAGIVIVSVNAPTRAVQRGQPARSFRMTAITPSRLRIGGVHHCVTPCRCQVCVSAVARVLNVEDADGTRRSCASVHPPGSLRP